MVLRVREVRRGVWWMYGWIREWAVWMAEGEGSILIVCSDRIGSEGIRERNLPLG